MSQMSRNTVKSYALTLILAAAAGGAQAASYVSDQLEITLRTGQSMKHQIVRMLKSGTAVEVVETDEETGYSRVRTADGADGWVLSRFLMDTPSARERLAAMEKRLETFSTENARLKTRLGELSGEKQALDKEKQTLSAHNERLESNLTEIRHTAASTLAIDNENKSLKEKVLHLETELQAVQQENISLKDRRDREWFVRGAGVVIAGIIVGLILPKIRWRRRSSWDKL